MISVIPATARVGARISISPASRSGRQKPTSATSASSPPAITSHAPPKNASLAALTSPIQSIAFCPVSGISPSTPLEIMSAIPPIKASGESTPQRAEDVVRLDRFKAARSCGPRAPDASSGRPASARPIP